MTNTNPPATSSAEAQRRDALNNDLASWLAAVPGLDARLRSQVRCRILDVGCGTGWSTMALARLYPDAAVHGIDLDAASLEEASRHIVLTHFRPPAGPGPGGPRCWAWPRSA